MSGCILRKHIESVFIAYNLKIVSTGLKLEVMIFQLSVGKNSGKNSNNSRKTAYILVSSIVHLHIRD